MTVRIVGTIRDVPAPTNLIALANGNGVRAAGGGAIQVRVRVGTLGKTTFDFDAAVQVTTKAGDSPFDTASALADAINASFSAASPPFLATARASANPPLDGQAIGSADILVGDPLSQSISLSILMSADAAQSVSIGRIVTSSIPDFSNADSHVGTLEERTLVKNYDSGSDRIDLFVVGALHGGPLGEAFTPNAAQPVAGRPVSAMVNTALVCSKTVTSPNYFHTTIPHEMGHILMDAGHADLAIEMMVAGDKTLAGADERVVYGPKRISDPLPPSSIEFDGWFKGNSVAMLRSANPGVLEI
jgi:hypothetical protein